jgi:hypothetical protein
VLIVCFFAVTLAAPAPEEILSYDVEDHKHSQTGDAGNAVKGSYRYLSKDDDDDPEKQNKFEIYYHHPFCKSYVADGKTYTVNYEADDKGYRATGDHLPVAPEVPAVPDVPAVPEVPVVEAKATPVVSTVAVPAAAAYPYSYFGYPVPHFGYGFNYALPQQIPAFSYFV